MRYLALALLLACEPNGLESHAYAQNDGGDVYINLSSFQGRFKFDCNFMPDDYKVHTMIRGAFQAWNSDLNIQLFTFVPDCRDEAEITVMEGLDPNLGPGTIAATMLTIRGNEIIAGQIFLSTEWYILDNYRRGHVILHEIGHLLGLAHFPDRSCLMYPSLDGNNKNMLCPAELEALSLYYPVFWWEG